jgi:hypothetical protein
MTCTKAWFRGHPASFNFEEISVGSKVVFRQYRAESAITSGLAVLGYPVALVAATVVGGRPLCTKVTELLSSSSRFRHENSCHSHSLIGALLVSSLNIKKLLIAYCSDTHGRDANPPSLSLQL